MTLAGRTAGAGRGGPGQDDHPPMARTAGTGTGTACGHLPVDSGEVVVGVRTEPARPIRRGSQGAVALIKDLLPPDCFWLTVRASIPASSLHHSVGRLAMEASARVGVEEVGGRVGRACASCARPRALSVSCSAWSPVWCTEAVAVDAFFRACDARNRRPSLLVSAEGRLTRARRPSISPTGSPDGDSGVARVVIGLRRISRFRAHLTRC